MTMVYDKADLNSLGFSSSSSGVHRVEAFEKMLMLKPHCLRFVVAVTTSWATRDKALAIRASQSGLRFCSMLCTSTSAQERTTATSNMARRLAGAHSC